MVLYNSTLNGMGACTGMKGNCRACPQRYGCLSYAISMLEGMGGNNQNMMTGIVENLETLSAIQTNSQEKVISLMENRLSALEEKLSDSISNVKSILQDDINFIKESQSYEEPIISTQGLKNSVDNGEELETVNETALATPTQKTWKEKKTLFGKTKWVEE